MLAVIDHRLPLPCQTSLVSRGFSLLPLPPFPLLSSAVASHPDMLLFRLGDKLFCHREYYAIAKSEIDKILSISDLSLCLTDDKTSETYPNDIALNLVFTGNILIGKKDHVAKKVKEHAQASHISLLDVKQGYTKCSCVVLNRALITADTGIARAAELGGLDCLLISSGDVELKGYSYGFLGGSSGVYGKTVFFCGNIKRHKDANRIVDFCRSHGYEAVSLSDEPLFDAGTLMFF